MVARTLLDQFDFPGAHARLLKREPNRVYRVHVADGRSFILRSRGDATIAPAAARLQQRWLDAIARQTDLVAPVVVALSGEPQPAAAMFTWVEGRRVAGPEAFLDPKRLAAVAATVAKLHRHAERFRVATTTGIRRFDADYFFPTDYSPLAARDRKLLAQLARRTRAAMRDLGEARERFGLIHGDLGPANWIFHGGAARPIDFEEFGVGYFLFDLVQVLWTHSMWRDYDDHLSRLIEGYELIRPLHHDERRHLPLFQTLPLVDWINRTLRANDRDALKRWLPPTMKCLRRFAARGP